MAENNSSVFQPDFDVDITDELLFQVPHKCHSFCLLLFTLFSRINLYHKASKEG